MLRFIFPALAALSLSGCVAALLPLAAVGAMGKSQIDRAEAQGALRNAGAVEVTFGGGAPGAVEPIDFAGADVGSEGGTGGPDVRDIRDYLAQMTRAVDASEPVPYADFAQYALEQSARAESGAGIQSAVLKPGFALQKPVTMPCGGKPSAVLIDLDVEEEPNGTAPLLHADKLYRQHGLSEAVAAIRSAGIDIVWLSDSPATAAREVRAMLHAAGLAEPTGATTTENDNGSGQFLFLDRGQRDGEADRKQLRRLEVARSYCVLAAAGDERADFDELYDHLRHPGGAVSLDHMFGAGWFLAPPPLVVAEDASEILEDDPS